MDARFVASAWTGVPVKEYASYFDTVYVSLYKYFGASGGAVLCGSAEVIDKMALLIQKFMEERSIATG
ncbi:MAG: hypothetical protein IPM04_19535 [Saprospiraceae bacterium]|nr:beta-eliminating lyase-related protein [Candidatus Brachybacter algidus]MBK8749930.1 hypothetical protein [Candidatus Brachybacter algidus]